MNKLIKLLFIKSPYHGTNEMFKELSMLKIKDIYEANVLKFVHKCINEPGSPIFRTYFQMCIEFHDRDLKYADRLHIPVATTAVAQSTTRNTRVSLWNKLPEEMKSQTDIKTFSKKMEDHSIKKYGLYFIALFP